MKCTARVLFIACHMVTMQVSAGPLLDVAKAGNSLHVAQLVKSGVDIRERGQQGETALHWMAYHGDEAMVRQLISAGAGINDQVEKGSTPLHLAAYNGHTGVAKILIEHGARVNVQTHTGITPLDWAKRNGHRDVEGLLIANGARAGQTSSTGVTSPAVKNIRLEDIKHFPRMDQILTRHRLSHLNGNTPTLVATSKRKMDRGVQLPQAALFRIQLAALGSEQSAVETLRRYRDQHPDILGEVELNVQPARVNGKGYYRVRTGLLSRDHAQVMCDQLVLRRQSCLVIKTESL